MHATSLEGFGYGDVVHQFEKRCNEGDRLRKDYSGAPVVDLETGGVLGIATDMEKDGREGLAISVEAF